MLEAERRELLIQNIDLLNDTLRPWGLDFIQLQNGHFEARLQQTCIKESTLQKISFDKHIWQRGCAPAGCLNVGILLSNIGPISWNNKVISLETIELFSPNDSFDVVSPAGFDAYTFSLHQTLVESMIVQCGLKLNFNQLTLEHQVLICNPNALLKIKMMMGAMLSAPFQDSNVFCKMQSLFDVSEVILQQLDTSDYSTEKVTTQTRNKIISRSFDYIGENLHKAINLGDLCTEVHTSLRTLNRCFNDKFNLSPKEVITLFRLHAFRNLIIKMPHLKIYALAEQCGFWHIGKLAADYRNLFGELPNQTRR